VRSKGVGSESGKPEFWSVKADGSDNRRELIDSLSSRMESFSWSPDGRSICWIRRLSQQCQEAMVYELSTGKGRQVTFDRKRITDVCWAPNDQIIFASKRSGNFNLWMVPASGGDAAQITRGAGPDYSMAISRDGSKLLYYQAQSIAHIWIAGTDGYNPHQITFDDAVLSAVYFSPDGKEVFFAFTQPVGMTEGSLVCSIDRDGRNRKELTSGGEQVYSPIPSPDGRWIIFGRSSLSEPWDSSRVYLIEAKNPGTPKLVGRGYPEQWIDNRTFTSWDYVAPGMSLNSIDGGEPRRFFEDSTLAFSLQGGKYIGYYDNRSGREGMWISAAPGVRDPSLPLPRKLAYSGLTGTFDKSGKFLYWVKNAGEFRRISIPSGREEIIRGVFPGLNPSWDCFFDISYDGKEIVYTDARVNSKLVMIENVFK
jgi:Tol biopolymer transport system component